MSQRNNDWNIRGASSLLASAAEYFGGEMVVPFSEVLDVGCQNDGENRGYKEKLSFRQQDGKAQRKKKLFENAKVLPLPSWLKS